MLMQQAIEDRNFELLTNVKKLFDTQYQRVPDGAEGKKLLTTQLNELKKSLNEAKPHDFFATIVKQKKVIHPKTVWNVGFKLMKQKNYHYLLNKAVIAGLKSGQFDVLALMLSMKDFDLYEALSTSKTSTQSVFCNIWAKSVSLQNATSCFQFIINEHRFDLNKAKGFATNILNQIETHCSYNTSENSEEQKLIKGQEAELFAHKLAAFADLNPCALTQYHENNSFAKLFNKIMESSFGGGHIQADGKCPPEMNFMMGYCKNCCLNKKFEQQMRADVPLKMEFAEA